MGVSLVGCGLDATGTTCSGHAQPGTVNLRDAMRERWGHKSDGIFNCRPVRGGTKLSEHGEGRAYDDHCDNEAEGRGICDVLVARACELGIEEIIFWLRIWTQEKGWHDYKPGKGGDDHKTHIHVGQNWSGALYLTIDAARAALAVLPPIQESEDTGMPKVMHFKNAIFLVGYDANLKAWRRTFPNPDRLGQVVQGGGVQVDAHGNAFEVTNADFEKVYTDLGEA